MTTRRTLLAGSTALALAALPQRAARGAQQTATAGAADRIGVIADLLAECSAEDLYALDFAVDMLRYYRDRAGVPFGTGARAALAAGLLPGREWSTVLGFARYRDPNRPIPRRAAIGADQGEP